MSRSAGTDTSATKEPSGDEDENEENSDYEWVAETDQDRRRAVLGSVEKSDLDGLKAWQYDYSSEFIFPPVASGSGSGSPSVSPGKLSSTRLSTRSRHRGHGEGEDSDVIELSSDEEDHPPHGCDVHVLPKGGTAAGSSTATHHQKERQELSAASHTNPDKQVELDHWLQTSNGSVPSPTPTPQKLTSALAQEEIGSSESRRLSGSDGGRQDLVTSRQAETASAKPFMDVWRNRNPHSPPNLDSTLLVTASSSSSRTAGFNLSWACQVCTL